MAKRKNGEGTYGEKIINGIKYKFYRDNQGHYTYAKTAKDLENKLKDKKVKEKKTKPVLSVESNLYTFGEYCSEWLLTKRDDIEDSTYDNYEFAITHRITGYNIANEQIKGLTVDMFNTYFKELSKKYSKGTIDKTWVVIRQVLQRGMRDKDIPTFDIMEIKRPKEKDVAVKKKKIDFIDIDDMEIFYNEVYNNNYGDSSYILIFIMYTGLRVSEAIDLRWDNVKHDYSSIVVRTASTRIVRRDKDHNAIKNDKGQIIYDYKTKSPKTASGERSIPLPQRAIDVLKYFEGKRRKDNNYVFTTPFGNPYDKRAVERMLSRILQNSQCNCKTYTPHSLRHGYGSVLISQGVDIKIVSELLGHADVSTTYNIYIHVLKNNKISAVQSVFDKQPITKNV